MNKEELIITNEDIELLKEMKNNCLKADVYNDEKRLLKANAITKFLMLQQENQQLKEENKEMQRTIELFSKSLYNADLKRYENILKELRSWLEENWKQSQDIWFVKIINKLNELEGGKNE